MWRISFQVVSLYIIFIDLLPKRKEYRQREMISLWMIKNYQTHCFTALFPESVKTMLFLAGLLTCPSLKRLPILISRQWQSIFKELKGLTAAGLFRTYTWFPFHRSFRVIQKGTKPKSVAKLLKNYIWAKISSLKYFILQKKGINIFSSSCHCIANFLVIFVLWKWFPNHLSMTRN